MTPNALIFCDGFWVYKGDGFLLRPRQTTHPKTMTTVPHATFVPKHSVVGSWEAVDTWERVHVSLEDRLWGMKADETFTVDGNKWFTFPLVVTHVTRGGEAWSRGVLVGDKVIEINSVQVSSRGDLLELERDKKKFVSDTIQDILSLGGRLLHFWLPPCSSYAILTFPTQVRVT
jgi:hypothetical protein